MASKVLLLLLSLAVACQALYISRPQESDALGSVKTLSKDSAALARDTDKVARSVISSYDQSVSRSKDAVAKTAAAKEQSEQDLKKLTDEVTTKSSEASKAQEAAANKIKSIADDSASKLAYISTDKEKVKADVKAETDKVASDTAKEATQKKAELSKKKEDALAAGKQKEEAASQAATKAASDVSETLAAGGTTLDGKVAEVRRKATEEAASATSKATQEAASAGASTTKKLSDDLQAANVNKISTQEKMLKLRESMVSAQKSMVASTNQAFDSLLSSTEMQTGKATAKIVAPSGLLHLVQVPKPTKKQMDKEILKSTIAFHMQ